MDIGNIKISVITPAFNDELFIKETIESVLNQSHKNLELIIVDDCSTDRTLAIAKSFNDSRIRIIQNDNNYGAAYSRNRALEVATGEYVAFLDADDLWKKNKLEKQIKFMIYNNYQFSYSKYSIILENDNNHIVVGGPNKITHKDFLRMNYVGCLTVIYRKNLFPDLRIPNDIYKRNDYALWLKLSERADCYLLDEVLAEYRRRTTDSISSGKKRKMLYYHRIMFQKLYGFGPFKSSFFSLRNAAYYIFKKGTYIEK